MSSPEQASLLDVISIIIFVLCLITNQEICVVNDLLSNLISFCRIFFIMCIRRRNFENFVCCEQLWNLDPQSGMGKMCVHSTPRSGERLTITCCFLCVLIGFCVCTCTCVVVVSVWYVLFSIDDFPFHCHVLLVFMSFYSICCFRFSM